MIKALVDRYVREDLLYHAPDRFLVPRFLLNDIARYWRTMAVDLLKSDAIGSTGGRFGTSSFDSRGS